MPEKGLTDYIDEHRKNGESDMRIRSSLEILGFDNPTIDEGLRYSPPKPKARSFVWIILGIIILAGVGAIGWRMNSYYEIDYLIDEMQDSRYIACIETNINDSFCNLAKDKQICLEMVKVMKVKHIDLCSLQDKRIIAAQLSVDKYKSTRRTEDYTQAYYQFISSGFDYLAYLSGFNQITEYGTLKIDGKPLQYENNTIVTPQRALQLYEKSAKAFLSADYGRANNKDQYFKGIIDSMPLFSTPLDSKLFDTLYQDILKKCNDVAKNA